MVSKLSGLGRTAFVPPEYYCHACGKPGAPRGYPGDIRYCTPCVPPTLRFPWEAGAVPAAPEMAAAGAPRALPRATTADAPLLPGFTPA